jgi:cobalt-zinc-cadmium efflux system outer membrane protein
LALTLTWAVPVSADSADPPALAALVAEALENNPELRVAVESLSAARTRPVQASARPDPMLSVVLVNDGFTPSLGSREMTTLALMASQDLSWPGKRSLRKAIAAADVAVAEQQLARARLGTAAAVRLAYHGLREARALLAVAREQAELAAQAMEAARFRYVVGQGGQADVVRVQLGATRLGLRVVEAQAEEAVRLAQLNRLLGRSGGPIDTPVDAEAPPAEPLDVALERVRALSPELAAARVAVERARLSAALARAASRPDFTVEAGYMNRRGLDPMWQAGLGLRLSGSRASRRAAVAEAEADLRAAEARVTSVESLLRLRTQERLTTVAAIEHAARVYAERVVPQGRLAVEAALAGYGAGRGTYASVLESVAALSDGRGALARLSSAAAQVRARLEEASLEATPDMPTLAAPMPAAAVLGTAPMDTPGMAARRESMPASAGMER